MLVAAYKQIVIKDNAEAFVNYVLPKIAALNLEDRLLKQFKRGDTVDQLITVFYYYKGSRSEDSSKTQCGRVIDTLLQDAPETYFLLSKILGKHFRVYSQEVRTLKLEGSLETLLEFAFMVQFTPLTDNSEWQLGCPMVQELWPSIQDITVVNGAVIWSTAQHAKAQHAKDVFARAQMERLDSLSARAREQRFVEENDRLAPPLARMPPPPHSSRINKTLPLPLKLSIDPLMRCLDCDASGKGCLGCAGSGSREYGPEWANCSPAGRRCMYLAPEVVNCTLCNGSKKVTVSQFGFETYRCPRCNGAGGVF